MDPELLSLDDLPADARQLIDEMEQGVTEIRDRQRRQVDEIEARAARAVGEIQVQAEEQVRTLQQALYRRLKPLQDAYAREGKLDEALAIRDRIRNLRASVMQTQPDPGNLTEYRDRPAGTQLLFEVIGSTDGALWGTDFYTTDSSLATAAVHAGVLRDGERGVVRVTLVDALNVSFTGSHRNGVWSEAYGSYPAAYRVERA
jgi:hypothetical protein